MYDYELKHRKQGRINIAGTDEAGRGPLAGPVVAAAVMLDEAKPIEGLDDSKVLSETARDALYEDILKYALATSIVFVDVETIDRINIYRAAQQAMKKAIQSLSPSPDVVLSDAMPLPMLPMPCESIVHGDRLSASIAAASILAKVARDRHMVSLAKTYPHYGFERHKGYPTSEHLAALEVHGPCAVHRRTFKPIKQYLMQQQKLSL